MNTLDTALMWRELGIATIPILARSKSPALDKWKPFQHRLPTEFELQAWFARPGYNLAVITGWQGLVIVDFDDWDKYYEWRYSTSIETYVVSTPRGCHYYFYCASPVQCVKFDGVDIRAQGGYCLAPPSVHPSGKEYLGSSLHREIARLDSMTDIFPEYQQAICRPLPMQRASTLDPLDAAMLPHTSTTIEEANAKLSYGQLLDHNPHIHGVFYCPFHSDTHPSLKVYPDGHWYCFGCNVGGRDKLDLYAKLSNMTIRETLCTL